MLWRTYKAINPILKDKLPIELTNNIVYLFKCDGLTSYVGQTSRQFKERLKEHCPKWVTIGNKTRPRSKRQPESAICQHVMKYSSFSDRPVDHFKILH